MARSRGGEEGQALTTSPKGRSSARAGLLLGVAGIVLLACAGGLWALGDLTGTGVPCFALLHFAACEALLCALLVPLRVGRGGGGGLLVGWVLGVGVAARALLLFAEPSLSQDIARYVWEGRVLLAGHDPYVLPPNHPELAVLRDASIWPRVNHPEVPAVYGPLLELLFAALAWLGGSVGLFKLAFVAADLGLLGLVLRRLRRRGASPLWILLYAWHPLVLVEVAGQGHLEAVPVALLLWALDLDARGRSRGAALALGAAVASKYLPLLVLPAFVLARPGPRARAERLFLCLLVPALAFAPFVVGGGGPTAGLWAYGSTWRFNDGGFGLLDGLLEASGVSQAFCRHLLPLFVSVDPGFDPAEHTTWMRIPPKLVVGAVVAGVLGWASWPRRGRVDLGRVAFLAGALFLLLSPTVHPWYALWVLPFLPERAARGERGAAAWILLGLLLPLAYAATVGPRWEDRLWVRLLEYGPFALLWLASRGRVTP
ncbi:MAG: DUF2029 domain-containing protein [Planctomycetota bacterium]|nr:MAG: DUF2029 domain-containing protein [Planctomycetota bacterium]